MNNIVTIICMNIIIVMWLRWMVDYDRIANEPLFEVNSMQKWGDDSSVKYTELVKFTED